MIIHIVKAGETLNEIASSYNLPLQNFLADNGLTTKSRAVVGQALIIVEPGLTHTVAAGETLISIANSYDTDLKTLYRNNYFLRGNPQITEGQVIVINYSKSIGKTFITNGYAYPFISSELLREQLPFMTYLTPFTYGITENGTLEDLEGDLQMIAEADRFGVKSLMHLSTLTEQGNFSSDRANLVFTNQTVRSTLTNNILRNIQEKGYDGLDVDFEFIYPENKYDYVIFLQDLYRILNPMGYPLFSALAPKTSDTQPGTLYEGHVYNAISSSVDMVLLMTYEWGYTYSEPMAVAPINSVEAVIRYGLTRIPEEKILMGIPTYGYDWTLPYEKGVTRATSLSPVESIILAERYGAEINYDTTAQTPWFRYIDSEGRLHEVWFEDARSIEAKLALAARYNLGGLGYWNLMRQFPQNMVLLNAKYKIA